MIVQHAIQYTVDFYLSVNQSQQGVGCSRQALHCTHLMTIYACHVHIQSQEPQRIFPAYFNMDKETDKSKVRMYSAMWLHTNMYAHVLTSRILFLLSP